MGRFVNEGPYWLPGNMVYGEPNTYPMPNIGAMVQSGNLYVYASGNPVMWVDPKGYYRANTS